LPSIAAQSQNKTYKLTMSEVTSTQLQATFLNTSPKQSSSTFGAVDMFVDLNWTIDLNSVQANVNGKTTGTVDLASPQGHIRLSSVGPVKPGDTLTVTFNILPSSTSAPNPCGDASWDADVWSGSNVGSGNFFTSQSAPSALLTSIPCAASACNSTFTANNVTATRELFNKDGTSSGDSCGAVSAFVSNTVNNNVSLNQNIVHFRWLQSNTNELFSTAVFRYTTTYATAPTSTNLHVGWLYQNADLAVGAGADPNANPANPVAFIVAPACLSSAAPAPYGSLKSSISATDTTLKVDTGTNPPPAIPSGGLPITVGTERILIASIGSSGWQVATNGRGAGGTIAKRHSKDDPVASTPLPTLSAAQAVCTNNPALTSCPYFEGQQAQMCVIGINGNTATHFDIGDGWGGIQ